IDFKDDIESKYSEYIYTMADGKSSCRYIQPEDPENTGDPALVQGDRILKVSLTNKKDADTQEKRCQTVTALFTRW
ncbi:MAG: hypothetical protein KAI50_04810, partial [Desulfobacterales bacterium]|nr:hypothetical protein [Desulfobacterales bacterium]